MEVEVTKQPDESLLEEQGVRSWPIWEKEASDFPWHYDETETCYIIEGRVVVTPEDGEPVEIEAGDFVRFPAGMSCHWSIKEDLRKHYSFG